MEELDDLKEIWNNSEKPVVNLEREKLEKVISKKSTGILDWLKIIAKIEDWGNFIFSIASIIYFIYYQYYDWAIVFGILCMGISSYFHYIYKIIHRISYSENVLEFLEDTYAALRSFLRKYLTALFVIYFISFIASLALNMEADAFEKLNATSWLIIIGSGIIGFFVAWILIYTYYYLVYGRKARKLKKMIESLKEKE